MKEQDKASSPTPTATPDTSPPVPTAICLGKHHDITSFSSDDASHYVLQSVHYHEKLRLLEATNGRILIQVPVDEVEVEKLAPGRMTDAYELAECIIPIAPFKRALGNIPSGGTLENLKRMRLVTQTTGETKTVGMITDDLKSAQTIHAKGLAGSYPDTRQAIPSDDSEMALEMMIDPEFLLILAAYAKKHRDEKAKGLKIRIPRESVTKNNKVVGPILFSFRLANGKLAKGVLIGMRIS